MSRLTYFERVIKWSLGSTSQIASAATKPRGQCEGFSLIEALVALAISSVIIVTTATLVRSVAGNFDRGVAGVDAADRLVLALERVASDLGSARFVVWKTASGPAVAFRGEQADGEKPARIIFVGAESVESGLQTDDELISFTIEQSGNVTRLVRRRAAWPPPGARLEQASLRDAVVLIEGNLDISFLFGRIGSGGALVWSATWIGETTLPRFVRLVLRDRSTGSDPVGEADFIVHADAPPACGRADAGLDCLSRVLPEAKRRAAL